MPTATPFFPPCTSSTWPSRKRPPRRRARPPPPCHPADDDPFIRTRTAVDVHTARRVSRARSLSSTARRPGHGPPARPSPQVRPAASSPRRRPPAPLPCPAPTIRRRCPRRCGGARDGRRAHRLGDGGERLSAGSVRRFAGPSGRADEEHRGRHFNAALPGRANHGGAARTRSSRAGPRTKAARAQYGAWAPPHQRTRRALLRRAASTTRRMVRGAAIPHRWIARREARSHDESRAGRGGRGASQRIVRKSAGELVDFVFDSLGRAIRNDGRFSYPGFGTWSVRMRRPGGAGTHAREPRCA